MSLFAGLLLTLCLLASCASPGIDYQRSYTAADGSYTEILTQIRTPTDTVEPATLDITLPELPELQELQERSEQTTGRVTASTGNTQGIDQALQDASQTASWIAVGLLAVGLGSLILRLWIPIIPLNASLLLCGSAAAIWAAPVLLDRYSLYLALVLAGIAGMYLYGMFDNKKLTRKQKG